MKVKWKFACLGRHGLLLRLTRYLIVFDPLTFALDQRRHPWQMLAISSSTKDGQKPRERVQPSKHPVANLCAINNRGPCRQPPVQRHTDHCKVGEGAAARRLVEVAHLVPGPSPSSLDLKGSNGIEQHLTQRGVPESESMHAGNIDFKKTEPPPHISALPRGQSRTFVRGRLLLRRQALEKPSIL